MPFLHVVRRLFTLNAPRTARNGGYMSKEIIESIKSLAAVKPFINLQALNRNGNPVLAAVIQFVEFGHTERLNVARPHPSGYRGWQLCYRFPNGYGASVVRTAYTYGGDRGLWELAVLDPDGRLCYSTPVTQDVLGYLTPEEVNAALSQIEALPPYQEGDDSSPDEGDFFYTKIY